jgi:hypothetical protein
MFLSKYEKEQRSWDYLLKEFGQLELFSKMETKGKHRLLN